MEIIEIKQVKINEIDVFPPLYYPLNIFNGLIDKTINIEVENLKFQFNIDRNKSINSICNYNDLKKILSSIHCFSFNLDNLRLKNVNTKKWGEKLIYNEGNKSLCFNIYYVKNENVYYIMFFNTDGTKEIENIYIHGIWKVMG